MRAVKNGFIRWSHANGSNNEYPVAEATNPLLFEVTDKDITKASKLKGYADPNNCVAACAIRRQFTDAIIQRDTAYTLQTHKGKTYAVRYRFNVSLRNAVARFDEGNVFPPGVYKLRAPTPSQTLEAKRLRAKLKPVTTRTVRPHTKFSARGKVMPMS